MDIQELGGRIKRVRKARGMTLKDVEAKSRVSATHISEIERGKTSPTINALSRISAALGKDTSFFLESRNLDEVSRIKFEERQKVEFKTTKGYYQPLSHGIPGGHLEVFRIHLEVGGSLCFKNRGGEGEATILVERGKLEYINSKATHTLNEDDSIHFTENSEHEIRNTAKRDACDLIMVGTRRRTLDDF